MSRLNLVLGVVVVFSVMGLVVASNSTSSSSSFIHPVVKPGLTTAGALMAVGAYFLWRRVWAVVDTPVMEAAGLRPGLFEVEGTILPNGNGKLSWFTEVECAYWEAKVEHYERHGNKSKWVTRWQRRSGRKQFWLKDESGHVRVDLSTASSRSMRTLVTKDVGGEWRLSERAYVVGEPLWIKAMTHADAQGLVVGQPEQVDGPKVVASPTEAGYIRKTRAWAMILTVLSAVFMATWTLWDEGISRHPEHLGAKTLVIRDGALLRPFMAIVAFAAAFWILSFFVRLYNRLVALKNQSAAAWANIDVAALQRHDLIEGLVAATKGAAAHERAVLERIAAREAQAQEQDAKLPGSAHVKQVDRGLTSDAAARTVIARAEAMPQLRAQQNFQQLFDALVRIEDRIASSRKYYNDAVMLLADRCGEFPSNLLAGTVVPGGAPPPLQFDPEIQEPVSVELASVGVGSGNAVARPGSGA